MCHSPTMTEHGGKRTREGVKSGIGRLERMKRGNGIKGRDDRSRGIEILMVDDFAKINPTEPLRCFFQDYVIPYLNITPFFTSSRSYLVDLNFVAHRS